MCGVEVVRVVVVVVVVVIVVHSRVTYSSCILHGKGEEEEEKARQHALCCSDV